MLLLPLIAVLASAQTHDEPATLDLAGERGPSAVVGGTPALPGEWPSVAALAYGDGFVACSGVLIHPEWVLTAGHCAPTVTAVYLDTTDLDSPGETLEIDDFVAYPDAFTSFDVALAHLSTPALTAPVPLALDCIADDWIRAGSTGVLAGFGYVDAFASEPAVGLNTADLPIDDPVCSDDYRGCNADAMPAGELIAGGDGVDSCAADSGAPFFIWATGRPWVAGITSRAAIPAPEPCGNGGIYVRADAVADWIEDTAGIVLDRPDCDGLNRPPTLAIPAVHTAMNTPATVDAEVTDSNLDQGWTLEVVEAPAHGQLLLGHTELVYVPDLNFVGSDQFRVRATDDGSPPESAEVSVPVTVTLSSGPSGCGCSHTHPGSPGAALLGLLLLWRRDP